MAGYGENDALVSGGYGENDVLVGAEPVKKKRTAADIARDIGVTGLKGLQGLQQSIIGLADLTTGGNVGRALEGVGIDGERTQQQLSGMYSEPQQEANRKVHEAEGFVDTFNAAIENPSVIATTVGESLPQMIGGAGVARQLLMRSKVLAPWAAGAIGEGTMGAGSAAESIREESADGLLTGGQAMDALGSGAGTTLFGAAGGKLTSKFGWGDVDTLLARGGPNAIAAGAAKQGFIKQVVGSGISEGVFEELPQTIQEQMWQNHALGKPLTEGVGDAAALGLLSGTAMGSAGGGYNAAASRTSGAGVPDNSIQAELPDAPVDRSFNVAPEPSAAEKALTEHKPLTALDRVTEIEAEDTRLAGRLAELDAPESGYGEMFNQERAEVTSQRLALDAEREQITQSWPAAVNGADTTFSTEAGVPLAGRYALMEAEDLQPSHDTNLRPNPIYPPDLQPRERDRAASEMQVSSITQKLDPARLGESADAANGAPIVGADGLVESGNARTIALQRVYQANGLKADQYRQHIAANAARFGLAPESITGMKNPVLVRVRTTPVNRAEFARQANAATVAAMSPSEQARSDAARMDDVDGLTPDDNGDFSSGTSRDFVRRFMAKLPGTEQAGMIDAGGNLSQTGYSRIRNAVLAKAYGDSPVLLRMVESLDDNLRNVSKALMQAAPTVAKARQAINEGALFDADIAPDLMAAVEELSKLKDGGVSVHDALAQAGMFGDQYSPETRELLQFLADNLRRPRKIADFITTYYQALNAAGNPAQGSLLGEATAPAKGDLLTAARGYQNEPNQGGDVLQRQEAGAEDRGQSGDAAGDQGGTEGNEAAGASELAAAKAELKAAWDNLAEVTKPKPGTLNSGFDPVPAAVALVRLFKAAYKAGTLNAKAAARYVLSQINTNKQYAHLRGTVDKAMLEQAARQAIDEFEREGNTSLQGGLFDEPAAGTQGGLFGGMDNQPAAKPEAVKPKAAMIGGRAYDLKRDNFDIQDSSEVFDGGMVSAIRGYIEKYYQGKQPHPMTAELRAEAERMLAPNLDKAASAKVEFDQGVIDIAKSVKALGQMLAPLKGLGRAAEKMHDDMVDRGDGKLDTNDVKDLLRATVVVSSYADVETVAANIRKTFKVLREKDKTEPGLREKNGGYADYTVSVIMPNGVVAEIQINVPAMLSAKEGKNYEGFGHKLFEAARSLREGNPLKAEILGSMRGLYDAAFEPFNSLERAKQAKNDSSDAGAPVRGPALSIPGNGNSESPSSDALNQPLPGINAYSSPENPNTNSASGGNLSGTFISSTSVDSVTQGKSDSNKTSTLDTAAEPEVLRKARTFATKFHKGQKRKYTSEGYITHPAGLVRLLRGVPHNENMLAAAWLHDTVEDTNATFVDVRAQFGVEVMGLVKELTKVAIEGGTRASGHEASLKQLGAASAAAQTVKLADIIHNTQNLREVDPLFADTYLAEKAEVLDVLTKGDATLMKVARGIVADDKTAYDEYVKGLGEDNVNGKTGAASTQGQGAGTASATGGKRGVDGVRDGAGGRDQPGSDQPGDADRQAERLRQDAADGPDQGGGDPQHGERAGAREGAGRDAGVPAGNDVPLKSGRNYAFGDTDLAYQGSWRQKAEQNVVAVELLKTLEAEGRQATHDEQATLAKFIGWGASEIANSIFGDKLNADIEALDNYDQAITNLGDSPYLTNHNYSRFTPAFNVLKAKNPALNWYTVGNITKAMLDAARPSSTARKWGELRNRLQAVMSKEEWAEAARSTQNAHYTSKGIVKSMWRAAERMGFKGGAIIEPGAGIGVFPGLLSSEMATNSVYTGIEMDSVTGGILKQLFPDERILVESFIDSQLPVGFYDMAAGNPPFAAMKVLADPKYKKYAFSLHDYFFAKTVDSVKPGGLVEFVTSRFSMDKLSDKARAYIAERADLVGAIRLPQTAFKQNAGTDVVTDVIFLRVKVPGETFEQAQAWAKSVPITLNGRDFPINEYFHTHPEMVLGQHSDKGKMANSPDPQYTVTANDEDIEAQFDRAVENLPENVYRSGRGTAAEAAQVREIDFNPKAKKEGNYYVTDAGVLMQREGGVGVRVELKNQKDAALLKDFVGLRDALKQAHYDQLNEGDWETTLAALQKTYAKFVKQYGQVNQFTEYTRTVKGKDEDSGEAYSDEKTYRRYPLLSKLQDDPDSTLVAALETINDDTGVISESKFLQDRVLGKPETQDIKTPSDALLAALNDTGAVSLDYVASRMGISEKEAIAALGSLIYQDPSAGWVMADEYLSGNVKQKLKDAQEAAKADRKLDRNVEALLAVQPAPVSPADITAKIGMNWIPEKVYEEFLHELTGVKASVHYNARTGQWAVQKISGHKDTRSTVDFGTSSRDAADILESALTSAPIRVTETVGSGKDKKTVLDPDATEAATQKRTLMRAEFAKWLWQDGKRADTLVQMYNDKFNTIVPRSFDGRHLTLPGSSTKWDVFAHVKRGAWRIIQRGNTYLAHAVGSGKTFQMVISAMEQKRLGLVKKPMMVVPNHMLQQFAREWQDLYPAARLMVADENNFHTDNRRRFVSRVALSDLDGVIITHSAFKLLDLDPEFKQKMIEQELDYLRAALEEVEAADDGNGGRKSPKVKQVEAKIERFEEKLKAAMSGEGKDKNVRFDELGVDMLYVDEAHEYRKLAFTTTRQVKGIDSDGSERAFDLWMKTRWLESKKPGRSLVMASGTPITNTMAELYSVQRFMAPEVLEARGLDKFDDWAAMFGLESTAIEPTVSGRYEPVTRFNKFVNVSELTQMFREFSDVLTSDHLGALLGDERPKVETGSRKLMVTEKTQEYKDFQVELDERVKQSRAWKPSHAEPNNPDPIIAIIGDGRLSAIDMRFIDPSLPNNPESKLNKLADNVIKVYQESAGIEYREKSTEKDAKGNKIPGKIEPAKGAAQMVFSDMGFGAGVTANRGFNARAWFEKRLRDAGIPASDIAFMSDYKKSSDKLKLFKDVNAGRVRILVGSSKNMGTGVNAQQRLLAMHHMDAPWYPADLEQREGRIVRQGNKNPLVQVYAFAMKGTYDEQMWSTLARKKVFIDQALSGDANLREIEDLSDVSQFEIAAAMVADDPRVMQMAGIRSEIEKYQRLYRAHEDQRARMRQKYNTAGDSIEYNQTHLVQAEKDAKQVQNLSGDKFRAKADGKTYAARKEWGEALLARYKLLSDKLVEGKMEVGEVSGFKVVYNGRKHVGGMFQSRIHLALPEGSLPLAETHQADPTGLAMRAINALVQIERLPDEMRSKIEELKAARNSLEPRLNAPFEFAAMLADKQKEAADLESAMLADQAAADAVVPEIIEVSSAPAETEIVLSTGNGGTMAVSDLEALRDRIAAKMENLPPVHVFASPLDDGVPLALRSYIVKQDATETVEGAMHDGAIYLFASGLKDAARAEFVLAEHEVTHYGLRGMLGKDLNRTMQHIWANNARVRKQAARIARSSGVSQTIAVEEVLADMTAAELSGLTGWRMLVGKLRTWLADHGFTATAEWLTKLLDGTKTQQAQADAFVADLVRRARRMVEGGGLRTADSLLSQSRNLAEDSAEQEQWLTREAKARGFKDIDDLAEKAYPVFEKLAAKWRDQHPAEVMLSRGNKTVTQRADAIIADSAATWRPVDALIKAGVKIVGIDRVTRALYNKAGFLLDRFTPETVKAGFVADYGIPGAVLDQRALMAGRKNVQLRKTGQLIDKLASLTRAESRVAYEWMNNEDPQAAAYFEQQLPAESLAVMNDVKKMIDSLSQEAVRLGQLDAETFKKNRFAYLRRSYIKHTAELNKAETASRQRTIAVLGDQYKARGITDGVDMVKVQNIAPDWWQRKMQAGKADKGLKGEKFIRLERRTHAGDGTVAMDGFGDRGPGKLREVAYFPAGQEIPTQYKDWTRAGTWEVRDTKGGKLIMWRDFTKQERTTMGEIDEARYAIAKTLHGMVQDVETGRYLQWLAENHAKIDGDQVDGVIVDASELMRDVFKPGEWVRVPDTKIQGTSVLKYGKLAGRYLPGPIWNDVRQVVAGRFKPLGETYAAIHSAWKTAKTALSPTVHTNNVMANLVMADWHDVTAGHMTKALRILLGGTERDGKGVLGNIGNAATYAGKGDREAAAEILNRFRDSGGGIGTWVTTEIQREQLTPLLESLEKELGLAGDTQGAQIGAMVALQKLLQLKLPSAWDAFKPTLAGKALTTEAGNMISLYEAEDQVFRLAAWLRAKESGATDMEAGKVARKSFLDYHINAPWVQMMRQTAFPFIAFTYRAVPMLLETAGTKPWKLMKLGLVLGAVNALGYAALGMGGDDEDDERRLLPEEKAGRIWGIVPKLLRMPWNDENDSPVFLDIRRFVPVGDIADTGATNSALPVPPAMIPGGPLALLAELGLNKSAFTAKPITLETDTAGEKAVKLFDHLYKSFAPNIVILPGTYAWTAVKNAGSGKTDAFGREQSTAQALASSFGVKLGAYPKDVLQKNAIGEAQFKKMEIQKNITALKREYQRNGIDEAEFMEKLEVQRQKQIKIMEDLREKL